MAWSSGPARRLNKLCMADINWFAIIYSMPTCMQVGGRRRLLNHSWRKYLPIGDSSKEWNLIVRSSKQFTNLWVVIVVHAREVHIQGNISIPN